MRPLRTLAAATPLLAAACSDPVSSTSLARPSGPTEARVVAGAVDPVDGVQAFMAAANGAYRAAGVPIAIDHAEIVLGGEASNGLANRATTIFANDREKHLPSRWVPRDARRGGRDQLTYATFAPAMTAPTPGGSSIPTEALVDAAARTWNAVACSGIRLVKQGLPSSQIASARYAPAGVTQTPFAVDVGIVGWLSGATFSSEFGPSGSNIVGVTFTSVFVDPTTLVPTDVDGDGNADEARAEIWFQYGGASNIRWTSAPNTFYPGFGFDAQSIALHELGHALDMSHFGRVVLQDNELTGMPFAVMNAASTTSMREPHGTDVAALCSNFSRWPDR